MRQLTLLLMLLAFVAAGALVVWQGAPWEAPAGALLPVLALAVWVAGPFGLLAVAAALARSRRAARLGLLLGGAALLLGGVVYLDAFGRRPHLLHTLLFLAVPLCQYPLAAGALAAALLSRRRRDVAPGA
ncbi:MAG TPA: hypothetical protein PKX99_05475 [Thermoanaerobaculia bacterium]|nr:hypothetical protein [Thermoanaerobaculia bacterium]